jgi:hypothetical protein
MKVQSDWNLMSAAEAAAAQPSANPAVQIKAKSAQRSKTSKWVKVNQSKSK